MTLYILVITTWSLSWTYVIISKKDLPIVVPDFITNSTGLLIKDLGFKNINNLVFENQYQFKDTELIFTIFKSGDLREDSGLFF